MRARFEQLPVSIKLMSLPALLLIASCTTSGGNVFSDAAPKGKSDPAASAGPQNTNAQNRLTQYCPPLRIRAGTESYRIYKKGDGTLEDNLRYQTTIAKVARECTYVGGNLEMVMGARGRIITGPAGKGGSFSLPIRIAVQEGGCSRHFELYPTQAKVDAGKTIGEFQFVSERIVIPAPKNKNIRMFIGFDPDGVKRKASAKSCS